MQPSILHLIAQTFVDRYGKQRNYVFYPPMEMMCWSVDGIRDPVIWFYDDHINCYAGHEHSLFFYADPKFPQNAFDFLPAL